MCRLVSRQSDLGPPLRSPGEGENGLVESTCGNLGQRTVAKVEGLEALTERGLSRRAGADGMGQRESGTVGKEGQREARKKTEHSTQKKKQGEMALAEALLLLLRVPDPAEEFLNQIPTPPFHPPFLPPLGPGHSISCHPPTLTSPNLRFPYLLTLENYYRRALRDGNVVTKVSGTNLVKKNVYLEQ